MWELVDTETTGRWHGTARTRRGAREAIASTRRALERLDRLAVERAVVALHGRPSVERVPQGLERAAVRRTRP